MISHSYAMDSQNKAHELASMILASSSPPKISAACAAIETFLQKYNPDQSRWFFSIAFPALICKIFGLDDSLLQKSSSSNGWIDQIHAFNDSDLAGRVFNLLSPSGVLMSSISAVDRHSLVKYVFPVERLPEWLRFMLQSGRDYCVLSDLCPLFKGRIKEDQIKVFYHVQLNVFEYHMFWFAYHPVCKGNCEDSDTVVVKKSRRFGLENWTSSFPVFAGSTCRLGQKPERSLYVRLLYAYLRAFVPNYVLAKTTPTTGLGEIVKLFVNYLNSLVALTDGSDLVEYTGSPQWGVSGSVDVVKSRAAASALSCSISVGFWNSMIQRPLYRFILRTFLFSLIGTSIKNVSQIFSLWISYMEPWKINLEDFTELDVSVYRSIEHSRKENTQSPVKKDAIEDGCQSACRYTPAWQGYVLSNYLFYSSLVIHFLGFAHKFLHTDMETINQMVLKVNRELMDVIESLQCKTEENEENVEELSEEESDGTEKKPVAMPVDTEASNIKSEMLEGGNNDMQSLPIESKPKRTYKKKKTSGEDCSKKLNNGEKSKKSVEEKPDDVNGDTKVSTVKSEMLGGNKALQAPPTEIKPKRTYRRKVVNGGDSMPDVGVKTRSEKVQEAVDEGNDSPSSPFHVQSDDDFE